MKINQPIQKEKEIGFNTYPLELIKTGIDFLKNTKYKPKFNIRKDPYSILILYCLQEMDNDMWLPVTRDYKPIGIPNDKWTNYEDYGYLFLHKSQINFDVLWDNGTGFSGKKGYYTYSDLSTVLPQLPTERKSKDKTLERYINIINDSLFEEDSKNDFEYYWKYKIGICPDEYYEYNLLRFKK